MIVKDWEQVFPMLKHWVFFDAANQMIPGRYWLDGVRDCLGVYEYNPFSHADHPFLTTAFQECIKRSAKLLHAKKNEVANIYRVMTASNMIINDLLNRARDRTKLVVLNDTMAWSGFKYDTRSVSDISHEHGALVLNDAIQSVGAIDVDVKRDDVDFLLTGSYKWQCGPEGAGIFYIKEELLEGFDPVFRNYLWASLPNGIPFSHKDQDNITSWDFPLLPNATRFDMGACVTPILFGWNETLKFYEKIGIENVERHVRALGDYAVEKISEIGCKVLTPMDRGIRHGLIMDTTGTYEGDVKTQARFNAEWTGEKPIKLSHRGIGGVIGLRVCCHMFNTRGDVDYLIEAQKKILKN